MEPLSSVAAPVPLPAGYRPGRHILASFCTASHRLRDAAACQAHFDALVAAHGLQKVGEAYHSFPGSGFTAVVCLTESHLSIHTWPEYGRATFDVFLSNYRRENDLKAEAIYQATLAFFDAQEEQRTDLSR